MIRALNPLEYLRARRSRQQAEELDTLFGAAIIGDEAGIIRLLRQGFDPNFQDSKGESGLHWAAAHGSIGIVRLLLEEGANPNIKDKRNASPLHIAADTGQVEVMRMLINGGSQVNCRDRGGSTPLHWAVSAGKKESVETLLEKGADVEAKDSGGVTPLMLAAHYGRSQIASILLQKGARADPKEEYSNTPLHSAAESGHLNLVDLLISKGADVNKQDESGFTALHLASKRGHRDIVKKLLQHGSDKDLRNEHGQTPVESATSPELKHLLRSAPSMDQLKKHQRSASGSQLPFAKLALPELEEPKKMSGQVKLVSFLKELQMEQYVNKFVEEEFDYDTLKEITEEDLIQMGVKIGSRRKLLAAIRTNSNASRNHSLLSSSSAEKNWTIDYSELHLMYEAGQGFYGAVYKGMWNNAEVAVKKIFPSKIQSMTKWLTEVEFLSTLRHPNIVVFYGACTNPPDICIVTEWVPRGSLHRVLAGLQANLDLFRLLSFATDIARGLAFLHMHDPPIIHRDLKSENLLVTNNWRIKLTDFGLSRLKDPNYNYTHPQNPFDVTIAAPEVLDHNHLSEKADIYSYALIMVELHTRKKAFEGKNPHWVAKSVLNEKLRPDLPAHVGAPMQELIELSWNQEYAKRPTAKELISRLEEIHRTESLKPAVPAQDSAYRKKLADSSDDTGETIAGSFIELGKKDANNYVMGSDEPKK